MTLAQAVDKYSLVDYKTVHARITKLNWSIEEALK
jgi:hypothetical protein